jgi:hypothetical protein
VAARRMGGICTRGEENVEQGYLTPDRVVLYCQIGCGARERREAAPAAKQESEFAEAVPFVRTTTDTG